MSQSASQVSTRSAPVAARERHCHYSCSALLSCPLPLTPVPSSSQASFHFVQKTQFLRSIMLLIVSGGYSHILHWKKITVGTPWTGLATALLSWGKEVFRRSVTRVQGLTVVQMIVSVNVSLGLCVSWLSEQCVMSSEPSGTLLSVASIISSQMPSLWWWQAEVIVLPRPCEFLIFF